MVNGEYRYFNGGDLVFADEAKFKWISVLRISY